MKFPKKSSMTKKKKSSKKYSKTESGKSVPTQQTPHLPEEIIGEILQRLPVKSLLRLRCVSKSWRSLIGSERFIRSQLEKSRENKASHQVVLHGDSLKPKRILKRRLLSSHPHERFPFEDPTNNHLLKGSCIVGHCDGLLCIFKEQSGSLFLWNPATKISFELPKTGHRIYTYGFGQDKQSGAYKVFAGMLDNDSEWICKVYSSETNSWKTVESDDCETYSGAGVLVGGKLYWHTEHDECIESFDLTSEVFDTIDVPFEEVDKLALGEARGRLNVRKFSDSELGFEEWVLVTKHEKGGAKEHWEKVETETERYENNIWRTCCETVYVESLVSPLLLKNQGW